MSAIPLPTCPDGPDAVLRAENAALRQQLRVVGLRLAELERLADSDTLTPLLNRRAFLREVDRAIARVARHNSPIAVLIGDVDGLKAVNDSRGHQAGDALIMHVGYTLKAELRASDVVARIGGDEFGMLLEEVDEHGVAAKIAALRAAIAFEVIEDHVASVAIGHTMIRSDDDLDAVIARADAAMYIAKRAQRSER